MHARAPRTLWLYILVEMWKLIGLTAAVLMTVVSFAMVVKPLADGKLGPADAVRFMVMAMPVAMQYTLPFAACFGATLSLYRLSSDNELTACQAGGISHRSILVPAGLTGLALALGLLVLSHYAIPRFLKSMQDLITQDATRLIMGPIERGEAVQIGGQYLYADQVRRVEPDRQSGAYQTLWLGGVVFVKLAPDGSVETHGIARTAQVQFKRVAGESGGGSAGGGGRAMTEVLIRPLDLVAINKDGRIAMNDVVRRELIPDPNRGNPKFLTFDELRQVRRTPEMIDQVDVLRHGVALTLGQHLMIESIRTGLLKTGRADLRRGVNKDPSVTGPAGEGLPVVLHAGTIRAMKNQPRAFRVVPPHPGEALVLDETQSDGKIRQHTANAAVIRLPAPEDDEPGERATLTLELLDVSAAMVDPEVDLEEGVEKTPSGAIRKWMLDALVPVQDPAPGLMDTPTWALIEVAGKRAAAFPRERESLTIALGRLQARLADLMREVFSKEQERLAYSVACLVMVLCGAVMAMRLRDSLPLTIYMWAFFPALACVICISAGQQLAHGVGALGLILLWGGVVALTVFTGAQFTKLARH